ncbi:PI-PLC domain-containing protein [Marinobacterium lutimaris]|uniref:Phosphatidylinositol diacylglycerol-lyase n=1 Tax=Marinobacterium lutimaris TaxID=568106 RepID=A0A1H6DWN9_9GAMM|nr:hypothetical protein [Marinobacterium lutimaris]SEG89609.1 hypothetical protein SAMN05444390_1143 [Marinobacterium lutimaris]
MKVSTHKVNVYRYTTIKNGTPVVKFSNIYETDNEQTPILSFYGISEKDPNSIPVYEHENKVDGSLIYSASNSLEEGWNNKRVAFYASSIEYSHLTELDVFSVKGGLKEVYMTAPSNMFDSQAASRLSPKEVVRLKTSQPFFIETIDKGKWMEQSTNIHGKLLRNICLPSAHDAGTSQLQDIKTTDNGDDLAGFLNSIKKIGDDIAATGIGIIIDIPLFLSDNLFGLIKGLGRTQSQTIYEQLKGGIRGLDIRVYYYEPTDTFYTYHGCLGEKLDNVLDDIVSFSRETNGEIIYLSFSHFYHVDTAELKRRVTDNVRNKLGSYTFKKTTPLMSPLEQTYSDIVNQGVSGTKLIITYPDYTEASDEIFWTSSQIGLSGRYSNKNNVKEMIAGQIAQYNIAVAANKPFELSMTLTPQESDVYERVAGSLAGPLAVAALPVALIPIYGWGILAAVETLCAALAIYNAALSWRTLEELVRQLNPSLSSLVNANFVPEKGSNIISVMWVDFYETSGAVDTAITLSGR